MSQTRSQRVAHLLCVAIMVSLPACHARTTSDYSLAPITLQQTEELLDADGGQWFGLQGQHVITFVDPRSESDYVKAHIPGAIHVPFSNVEAKFHQVQGGGILIVYGSRYEDPLAKAMSKRLIELGAADVRTLDGGIRSWEQAGKPVVSGKKPMPSDVEVNGGG